MTCLSAHTGLTAAAVLAAALAVCLPAHAGPLQDDPFAGIEPLDLAELGESRGGMMINGIPINFAVVISTTVEGAVSQGLQTLLTVNDQGGLGSAVTTAIGTESGTTVTANTDGSITMNLPTGTTIIHQVLADQITAMIANTTSNVELKQQTQVNVDLPGFQALTQTWYGNNRAAQMGVDAAMSGLGHR